MRKKSKAKQSLTEEDVLNNPEYVPIQNKSTPYVVLEMGYAGKRTQKKLNLTNEEYLQLEISKNDEKKFMSLLDEMGLGGRRRDKAIEHFMGRDVN